MFTNPVRQIDRLKAEIEKLKCKNEELTRINEELENNNRNIEQRAITESERAQKVIAECDAIQKQWKAAIEAADKAREQYDSAYRKMLLIAKM